MSEGLFTLAGAFLGGSLAIVASLFKERSADRRGARGELRGIISSLWAHADALNQAAHTVNFSQHSLSVAMHPSFGPDDPEGAARERLREAFAAWKAARDEARLSLGALRIAAPGLAGVATSLIEASAAMGDDDWEARAEMRQQVLETFEAAARTALGVRRAAAR